MKLNHLTLDVSKNKDTRNEIISGISRDVHNGWRNFRLLENTEDTYTVRWKNPFDSRFENFWKIILNPSEQLSIQKKQDGKIYIDIANTHGNQLSEHWKQINKEVAEFSLGIIQSELSDFSELSSEMKDKISAIIHDYWRKNNPDLEKHFLFWATGKQLLQIKYGNISWEYIDYIRKNIDAQVMWEELGYELKAWYQANIYEATDEQIKNFLIEQIDFDLKKDFDKFAQSYEITKKITQGNFSQIPNLREEIINASIVFMHEIWRKDRLLNDEGTHQTRWKEVISKTFVEFWNEKLWVWEFISVKRNSHGDVRVDIANTCSEQLPIHWQEWSRDSAEFSVTYVTNALLNHAILDADFWFQWAIDLHNHWLSRHDEAKDHFIIGQSWEFLREILSGKIDAEFILKVRTDIKAYRAFLIFAREKNIKNTLKTPTDDEIKDFLIAQARFNLLKDTNIILYAVKNIQEKFYKKYSLRNELLILAGNPIVWYLSHQDIIVDFNDIKSAKVPWDIFFNNFPSQKLLASSFQINGKSLNEQWAFCASFEKLESYNEKKLEELGIITDQDYTVLHAYKKYVQELQESISQHIQLHGENDRDILDTLLDDMTSRWWTISKIGTTLNPDNVIENGNHNKIPLKKIDRIMEKVLSHGFFDGDFRKVSDIVRGTLEFDNVVDLYKGLEAFLAWEYFQSPGVKILIKDNIWNPLWEALNPQKYRDINCIIKLHNGHTVELQFQLKPMLEANNKWIQLPKWTIESLCITQKEREYVVKIASKIKKPKIRIQKDDFVVWHEIYEIWRSISYKDEEQKDLKDKLNTLLMIVHDEAWKQSLYAQHTDTKLSISSYEMEIRKSLDYMLSPDEMEKDFKKLAQKSFSSQQVKKIDATIQLIKQKHQGQYRDEHTPYYTHCIHTALLCLQDDGDFDDILVCLLHDILEDSDISENELTALYGEKNTKNIHILSKAINWEFLYANDEEYYNNLSLHKKALKYKAYDRLSNLISLYFSPLDYQEKYKQKTWEQLLPILEKDFGEIVEKYKKIFRFLEKHQITEDEKKKVDEFHQIRILQETIKKS